MTPNEIIADFLRQEYDRGLFAEEQADKLVRALANEGWGIQQAVDPSLPIAGRVGRDHAETSQAAAAEKHHRVVWGSDRTNCLLYLHSRGPQTAAVLADHFGWSRNQTATRMMELRAERLVDYLLDGNGKRVTRSTGPSAHGQVQTITPLGVVAARRLLSDNADYWSDWMLRADS